MAVGPGKYDDACRVAREQTKAKMVLLIVVAGDKGGGFSAQCEDPAMMLAVPDLLETVAAQIREDMQR